MVGRPHVPSFITTALLHGPSHSPIAEQEQIPEKIKDKWREIVAIIVGIALIIANVGSSSALIHAPWLENRWLNA